MENEKLIDKYESEIGKNAVMDGKETIGFKRWKQQQESHPKIENVIPTFRESFKKDVRDIIKIYLKKVNICPSQKSINTYLKQYIKSVFPSEVIYKGKSFEMDSGGTLHLYKSDIKDLRNVKGLFKLRSLKILKLRDNEITKIPKEIGNLQNLESLRMEDNEITKIPKEIGNLQNLKRLYIGGNNLRKISKEIGNLKNLEGLDIEDNNISEIPKEIGNLASLRFLSMMRNNIFKIPKEIGNLKNLEKLNVMRNNISEIPKEIGNLTSLRFLYMTRNNISKIPKEIGNLKNLKDLHINDNNITKNDIPSSLLNNKDIDVKF